MNPPELILILAALLSVGLVWIDPRGWGQDAVAGVTLATLVAIAPLAALWLCATTLGSALIMRFCSGQRALAAGLWSVALAGLLLLLRDLDAIFGVYALWLGAAYFTLRQIHVVMDWWLARQPAPTLRQLARYHLLAPVLFAGPIHRIAHFERTLARRCWDAGMFFNGAERALFGAVLAFVVGEFMYAQVLQALAPFALKTYFLGLLAHSAMDWVVLYIAFSGLTDLALGLAAMMGLKLEENFRRPYAAKDLIDFWQRWHMTLTHWCRDYIYIPVASGLRSPVLGVIAAMLVIGLWHETSAYYVLWAIWQALGIILTHRFVRPLAVRHWAPLTAIRGMSFLWLALANPIAVTLIATWS